MCSMHMVYHVDQVGCNTPAERLGAENKKLSEQLRSREAEFIHTEKSLEAKYSALEEKYRKE